MKLHELLDYIRPTQPIKVVVQYDGENILLIDEKPYNHITLIEAFDYMQDEVMEIEAIEDVLMITLDEEGDY